MRCRRVERETSVLAAVSWLVTLALGPMIAYASVDQGDLITAALFAALAFASFLATVLTIFPGTARDRWVPR